MSPLTSGKEQMAETDYVFPGQNRATQCKLLRSLTHLDYKNSRKLLGSPFALAYKARVQRSQTFLVSENGPQSKKERKIKSSNGRFSKKHLFLLACDCENIKVYMVVVVFFNH